MRMKTKTFEAKIYIGLREGYTGSELSLQEAEDIIRSFIEEFRFGITITPTKFMYPGEKENGLILGIINYPRFPDTEYELTKKTLNLAKYCLNAFKQYRCSVVFPNETVMLERGEE